MQERYFFVSLVNNGERKSANAVCAIIIFQTFLRGENAEIGMFPCICTFHNERH